MHQMIENLMNNDVEVVEHLSKAKAKWEDIFKDITTVSVADLAKRLTTAQSWFEVNCGGRDDGKEIMAWTGFAVIYDTGAGYDRPNRSMHEAVKLAQAFVASSVSIEVKGGAHKAALSYHINYENKTYSAD